MKRIMIYFAIFLGPAFVGFGLIALSGVNFWDPSISIFTLAFKQPSFFTIAGSIIVYCGIILDIGLVVKGWSNTFRR